MAITFGVMLHMDRAPAAAVAPMASPVIEATVIPQTVNPVLPVGSARHLANFRSPSHSMMQTYDARGERRSAGDQSGSRLDLFA